MAEQDELWAPWEVQDASTPANRAKRWHQLTQWLGCPTCCTPNTERVYATDEYKCDSCRLIYEACTCGSCKRRYGVAPGINEACPACGEEN
jgi:hypothetical protein